MPIKDSSIANVIFQQVFDTKLQLSDIMEFIQGREDIDISSYIDQGLLTAWAEGYSWEKEYCDPGKLGAQELYEYLSLQASPGEIIGLLDDPDIVEVSTKPVEWLVETLMERDQAEVESYLEIHGFVRGERDDN